MSDDDVADDDDCLKGGKRCYRNISAVFFLVFLCGFFKWGVLGDIVVAEVPKYGLIFRRYADLFNVLFFVAFIIIEKYACRIENYTTYPQIRKE